MQFRDARTRWQFLPGRRLLFEELERRDLLAVMRIVDWNTFNRPNNVTDDANFRTIFQAIGNETVQGNTQRIDILALQETDPPGNGDSITRVENVLNTLYSTTSYNLVASPADGGGDSTGFVYDTSAVSLLGAVQISAGALTHNIMRAEFQPVGSPASSIFYVYSVHLKSGDTNSDATIRGSEAALLRADADSLGEGTQVLFVGDFNMHTSAEPAWTNMYSAGAGQLQDVANAPGAWLDNPAFKSLHSQDPGAAMDDRFDIQFASGEFFDGGGVDYVPNSFHIFGNNGTHTLNSTIDTGTGAAPDVLAALIASSDHLPAVADYNILSLTPSVRISETLGSTKVVEGGLYDTYQMVLNTVPTANVVVTVSPDSQVDIGNGAGVSRQFTFTPANALTPQTVEVHATDDALLEGNHPGLITHTSASADAVYNGLSISNVIVSIVDNDAPALVINEVDADQVSTDTQEFVELYDGGVGHVSLNGKSLVLFRGTTDTAYTVVTFGPLDFTDANGFFVVGDSAVTPAPNKLFSTATNSLQQGPAAVALYSGAFSVGDGVTTTNLIDALVYATTNQADDTGLLALLQSGQPQINENQNSLGTTQSMSRVPDGISANGGQRMTATYVAQAPTPSTFNQALPFGVLVLQSGSSVNLMEGGVTDSYQIALQSIPTANVQITVDPDNQTDLGAGAGVAIALTFTPANALIPQTVNVTAVDDATVEGNHTSTITHTLASADSRYNGFSVPNVVAAIVDNDSVGSVPGDYNANHSVDAADYVVWRKTLNSTTQLQADGSGPTVGVPNGVVDQADYAFWRSRFGNVGPGSGAGAGEMLVATNFSEPAAPASGESELSVAANNSVAVDPAMSDISPAGLASGIASHPTLQPFQLSRASASADSLLTIIRPATTTESFDDSADAWQDSSDFTSEAVDQLFASLGESDVLTEVGLFSVVV
jgi:endonuclease/exonuclease/phosphatase family metal-dependent hydrolase